MRSYSPYVWGLFAAGMMLASYAVLRAFEAPVRSWRETTP